MLPTLPNKLTWWKFVSTSGPGFGLKGSSDTCSKRVLAAAADEATAADDCPPGRCGQGLPIRPPRAEASFNSSRYSSRFGRLEIVSRTIKLELHSSQIGIFPFWKNGANLQSLIVRLINPKDIMMTEIEIKWAFGNILIFLNGPGIWWLWSKCSTRYSSRNFTARQFWSLLLRPSKACSWLID